MKRITSLLIIIFLVFNFAACTAPTKTINGTIYRDYGILNTEDKNPNIQYEPNWTNIFLGVIFFEMIIPPIYVFGFHLFEPIGPRSPNPGQVYPN